MYMYQVRSTCQISAHASLSSWSSFLLAARNTSRTVMSNEYAYQGTTNSQFVQYMTRSVQDQKSSSTCQISSQKLTSSSTESSSSTLWTLATRDSSPSRSKSLKRSKSALPWSSSSRVLRFSLSSCNCLSLMANLSSGLVLQSQLAVFLSWRSLLVPARSEITLNSLPRTLAYRIQMRARAPRSHMGPSACALATDLPIHLLWIVSRLF